MPTAFLYSLERVQAAFSRPAAETLGTEDDIAEAKLAIEAHFKSEWVAISKVRWLTKTVVAAYSVTEHVGYFCLVEHGKDGWKVIDRYQLWVI